MTMFWLVIGLIASICGIYAAATWPDLSGPPKYVWRYFYGRLWGRILMASLLYLTAFGLIFWWVGGKIEFLNEKTLPVENWDDRRSFGLGVSGFMLAWLAIIGAILSAARTKAMEDTNRETRINRLNERYENALKSIDGEGLSAIGAIETVKTVALQDESLLDETIRILCSYLNRNAQIDNLKTNTCSRHKQFYLHFQHALLALVELQRQRLKTADLAPNNFVVLVLLDLRMVRIPDQSAITGFHFGRCNFDRSLFSQSKLSSVLFVKCKMIDTIMTGVELKKAATNYAETELDDSEFDGAEISDVDFVGIASLAHGQMAKVRYDYRHPPKNFPCKLPDDHAPGQHGSKAARPILPTPWNHDEKRYLNLDEAIKFHRDTADEYRPRHSDGSFVRMVDPNEPNIVIPDSPLSPSDTPKP